MKELSIEEKAQRYDELVNKLRRFMAQGVDPLITRNDVQDFFPELKESEDEKIRKWCISHFKACINVIKDNDEYKEYLSNKVIAWLEKQGELVNSLSKGLDNAHERIDGLIQKNNLLIEQLKKQGEQKSVIKMKTPEESLGIDSDTYNKIVDDCVYGEQKPADKVEPKFRIGDIIRHKKQGFTCKIIAIDTEYRLSDCCGTHLPFDSQDAYELVEPKPEIKYVYTNFRVGDVIVEIKPNGSCQPVRVKYIGDGAYLCDSDDGKRSLSFPIIKQDEYKLVEQNPTWSEEDEKFYSRIYNLIHEAAFANYDVDEDGNELGEYAKITKWFKSIKERYTWKPSDEQMNALDSTLQYSQVSYNSFEYLNSLFNDLKKLKG